MEQETSNIPKKDIQYVINLISKFEGDRQAVDFEWNKKFWEEIKQQILFRNPALHLPSDRLY